jgi:hypothetical protein
VAAGVEQEGTVVGSGQEKNRRFQSFFHLPVTVVAK